jgi:imidazolonepropionase-like amidohydrolase
MMLIKVGILIDGTGRRPQADMYVEVDNGRIKAVGRSADFAADAVLQAVDFSQQTVLPGLIDTHVHLFLEGIYDLQERGRRWQEDKEFTIVRGVKNLEMTLRKGVTTVRDLGGPYAISSFLKKAVRRQVLEGSRIWTANRAISITGGHFNYAGGREADGPAAMVKAVREQVKEGADCIKVMMTGCVNFQKENAGIVELTVAETEALVNEAHRMGKHVAVHANGVDGVRQALAAGVQTLEHGALLDERAVDELAASSACWIPTLLPFRRMLDYSCEYKAVTLPQVGLENVYYSHQAMVRRGIAAGAKIVAGTDAGALGVEHGDLWWELALLVEAGLAPLTAISAATSLAAEAIGLEDEVGRLVAGKQADILVVEGNPLEDISCLRNVRQVYKAGVAVKA